VESREVTRVTVREIQFQKAPPIDLVTATAPNWTAVWFFATLSFLHWCICLPAFAHGRWEGYLSLIFASVFAGVTLISYRAKCEVAVLPVERRIRLRSGVGRLRLERSIAFDDVHGVRLTINEATRPSSHIEVLCDNEDIIWPPTSYPRQHALYLAVTMGVRLIKVIGDDPSESEPSARDRA
jgi:hypothetical protein